MFPVFVNLPRQKNTEPNKTRQRIRPQITPSETPPHETRHSPTPLAQPDNKIGYGKAHEPGNKD